jgi:hypothetical protein
MVQDRGVQNHSRRYAQLVAMAWVDPAFKQRLLESPTAVFVEQGIDVPNGVEPRVVENTDRVQYMVLPRQPIDGELSDEQLRLGPVGYHGCGRGGDS